VESSNPGGTVTNIKLVMNFTVLQELVLRKMILAHAHELPRSDYEGYCAQGPTQELTALVADAFPKKNRRRLTSDALGYRSPHANGCDASTRRHIRRLLASEATGHAC